MPGSGPRTGLAAGRARAAPGSLAPQRILIFVTLLLRKVAAAIDQRDRDAEPVHDQLQAAAGQGLLSSMGSIGLISFGHWPVAGSRPLGRAEFSCQAVTDAVGMLPGGSQNAFPPPRNATWPGHVPDRAAAGGGRCR